MDLSQLGWSITQGAFLAVGMLTLLAFMSLLHALSMAVNAWRLHVERATALQLDTTLRLVHSDTDGAS